MSYHNITTNRNQDHRDGVMSPRTTNVTMGINGANGVQGTNPKPSGERPSHPGLKKEEVPALNKEIITHQSILKDGEIKENSIVIEDPEKISIPRFRGVATQPVMEHVYVPSSDNMTPPQPMPMNLSQVNDTNNRSLAQIFFNPLNMSMPEELQDNVDITSTTKYIIDDLELTLLGTFNTTHKQLRAIVKFPLDDNIIVAVDQHIKHIYFLNKDGILDKYSLYGMDFNTLSLFLRKLFDIGNVYVHQDFNAIIHRIMMGRQNRIRYAVYEDELPKTEESNVMKLLKK